MKRFGLMLLSALWLASPCPQAAAQTAFPNKPVKIIVPYAAGGATDVVARILGEQLRQIFGQAFVVENKPGASGILAIEEMARSKPDGHTLMIGNVSTMGITPVLLTKKMTIDFGKDVRIVARVADYPVFLTVTTTDFPPKTVAEFVAYAKIRPGQIRYSSAGIGSIQQFDSAALSKQAGLDLVHIPAKAGGAQMLRDLATGDTHVSWLNIGTPVPFIKAGQMRPLAIVGDKRHPEWPDVPTMAESGFPGIGSVQWQALYAPAGVPADIVAALHKAIGQALEAPAVKEAYKKSGIVAPARQTIEEAAAWQRKEIAHWKQMAVELKIEAEE
jgi:tripartite-type tricarboxylate transporter receptor subunit TctC